MYVLLTWVYILIIVLILIVLFLISIPVYILSYPVDKNKLSYHFLTMFWANIAILLMPMWKIKITGRHHLKHLPPSIIVCNHLSTLDILVMYRLWFWFKWVSKSENFQIPLVGFGMRLNKYIELERGNPDSTAKMFNDVEKAIQNGNHVIMFPEGTRSRDGVLLPFKTGAFVMAKNLHVPVLPIIISGTEHALPKYSLKIDKVSHIFIDVLPPIWPEHFEGRTMVELRDESEAVIREKREERTAGR